MSVFIKVISISTLILFASSPAFSSDDMASSPSGPYFNGGSYNAEIPQPSEFLGFSLASKPINHTQLTAYFRLLADSSPRAEFFRYGETYEGHDLIYLAVSSPENLSRMVCMTSLSDSMAVKIPIIHSGRRLTTTFRLQMVCTT